MSKNKALISIIVFLLATNIAMLVFFLILDKPTRRASFKDSNGMADELKNNVGFSNEQVSNYLSLRKEQYNKIHPLFEQLKKTRYDFYDLVYEPQTSDSVIMITADSIATAQKMLDMQMLAHFKTVRKICTPDQLPGFDSTIKKVFVRMIDKHRN